MAGQLYATFLTLAVSGILVSHARDPLCPSVTQDVTCPALDFASTGINFEDPKSEFLTGEKVMFSCDINRIPYPSDMMACLCKSSWTGATCLQFVQDVIVAARQSSVDNSRDAELAFDNIGSDADTCAVTKSEKVNYWIAELVPRVEVVALEIDVNTEFGPSVFLRNANGLWSGMECNKPMNLTICYSRETGDNTTHIAIFSSRRLSICNVAIALKDEMLPRGPAGETNITAGEYCGQKGKMCSFSEYPWITPQMDMNYTAGQVARYACPDDSIPYPTSSVACQCDGTWGRGNKYCLEKSPKVMYSMSAVGGTSPELAVDGNNSTCIANKKDTTYWEAKIGNTRPVAAVRLVVDSMKSGTFCPDVSLKEQNGVHLMSCTPYERYTPEEKTVCLCYATDFRLGALTNISVFSTASMDICEVEVFLTGDYTEGHEVPKSSSETLGRHQTYLTVAAFLVTVASLLDCRG